MSMSVPRSANATRLPIGADCNAIIADVSFDSMGMKICSIKNEYSMNLYGLISRMIRYHVYFLSADIHIYTYMKLLNYICIEYVSNFPGSLRNAADSLDKNRRIISSLPWGS